MGRIDVALSANVLTPLTVTLPYGKLKLRENILADIERALTPLAPVRVRAMTIDVDARQNVISLTVIGPLDPKFVEKAQAILLKTFT